jgi:hypothetical protein
MDHMATKKSKPVSGSKRWILYVVLIAILSWLGMLSVVQLSISPATKTLFFSLLFAAVTTTTMPVVAYLNARFGKFRDPRLYRVRFVRQSIWLGVFAAVVAWLQARRMLDATVGLILLAVLALIEAFMITRDNPVDDL